MPLRSVRVSVSTGGFGEETYTSFWAVGQSRYREFYRLLRRLERASLDAPPPLMPAGRLDDGRLVYRLKHRWRDGTTAFVFEPEEFVARLAALVPPPRPCRARRPDPWAELMRRVFAVDVLECPRCHGPMKILAAIHPPDTAGAILECLGLAARPPPLASPRRTATALFEPDPDWSCD